MNLTITEKERDAIVTALQIYRNEVLSAKDAVRSIILSENFEKDAADLFRLTERIASIPTISLENSIRSYLPSRLIEAIKFCRAQTGMSLKEAKEYVENIRDNNFYDQR